MRTLAGALRWSARSWLLVAAIGQAALIGFILLFYGVRTVTGNFAGWNDKPLIDGYIAGDGAGNAVFAAHVLIAALVTFGGLMQLVPAIRRRAPALHRWSGRVFLGLAVFMAPTTGYLIGWVFTALTAGYLSQLMVGREQAGLVQTVNFFIAALVGGVIVLYGFGISYLALVTGMGFSQAFLGSMAFIPGDVLKALIAALAGRAVMVGYPLLPQRA